MGLQSSAKHSEKIKNIHIKQAVTDRITVKQKKPKQTELNSPESSQTLARLRQRFERVHLSAK